MKESVSDIIDHRLDPRQVSERIQRLSADADGCRVWRNYHLIGDVIRGEVVSAGACLIDRVEAALNDEPTVLVPARANPEAESAGEAGSASGDAANKGGARGDTLKAAGLFAVAASLALVAVITQVPSPEQSASPASIAASNSVSPATGATGDTSGTGTATGRQEFASEFGQMLVEHGEFSATTGLNGLLAYAKVVSNEPLGE